MVLLPTQAVLQITASPTAPAAEALTPTIPIVSRRLVPEAVKIQTGSLPQGEVVVVVVMAGAEFFPDGEQGFQGFSEAVGVVLVAAVVVAGQRQEEVEERVGAGQLRCLIW